MLLIIETYFSIIKQSENHNSKIVYILIYGNFYIREVGGEKAGSIVLRTRIVPQAS